MSRVGNQPVTVPAGVTVDISQDKVSVKGPKGTVEQKLPRVVSIKEDEGKLLVSVSANTKQARALHGLHRALLKNAVVGVTEGYRKTLEIHGVSYQARLQGNELHLQVGFANTIVVKIPADVAIEVPNPTLVHVTGVDSQRVGQVAADIRAARKPEPYKGKGVRYQGEQIQRKQGKSFVSSD